MSLFQQLIQFLSSPPDSLVYHLVTLLALQATLALALWQTRRQPGDKFARRLAGASGGIIVARLIFLFASIAAAEPQEAIGILPPLERAIDAVTVALLVWALAPHPKGLPHLGDVILIFLLLVILLMYAFFAQEWLAEVELGSITREYAETQQAIIWDLFQIGLLLTGSVLILLAKESDWSLRLAILILLSIVHAAFLFYKPTAGQVATDITYWVRLGNLVVFPLLVVLTYRHSLSDILPAGTIGFSSPGQFALLMDQLREVIHTPELDTTINQAINFAAGIFGSNLSAIAIRHGDQEEELTLYGQWSELTDPSVMEPRNSQILLTDWPAIQQAMLSKEQFLLVADAPGARQLHNISQQLDVGNLRSALITPLNYLDSTLGISILATSSDRYHWPAEQKAMAFSVAGFLAQVIHNADSGNEVSDLQGQLSDKKVVIPAERVMEATPTPSLNQVNTNPAQEPLSELEVEIETLRSALREAEATLDQAQERESLLSHDWVLRTVTRYSGELETAHLQIQSLESKIAEQLDVESYSPISSKIIALRTPLTAVCVYTEMLISEGQTLSPLKQKSILHRVQANTEYMIVVLEEMARSVRSAKPPRSVYQPVDIKEAIEASVSEVGVVQRRKRLKFDLIVDDDLPLLYAPDKAFFQIMINLLTSACNHTLAEGRISITAHTDALYESFEKDTPGSSTFLHVAIVGQPVTSHIKGDTHTTLATAVSPSEQIKEIKQGTVDREISLARELVSSCNGRVWIDLESSASGQFSLLIPLFHTAEV